MAISFFLQIRTKSWYFIAENKSSTDQRKPAARSTGSRPHWRAGWPGKSLWKVFSHLCTELLGRYCLLCTNSGMCDEIWSSRV